MTSKALKRLASGHIHIVVSPATIPGMIATIYSDNAPISVWSPTYDQLAEDITEEIYAIATNWDLPDIIEQIEDAPTPDPNSEEDPLDV